MFSIESPSMFAFHKMLYEKEKLKIRTGLMIDEENRLKKENFVKTLYYFLFLFHKQNDQLVEKESVFLETLKIEGVPFYEMIEENCEK